MTTLFTNARLIDPEALTETTGALLVADGIVKEVLSDPSDIAAKAGVAAEVIDCGGKALAPGIVDIGVKISEPGERNKESFRSAGLAAAAGGVTTMVTRPDTLPAIGPSPHFANAYYAFGHSHVGLALGGMTGRLIADLVAGTGTSLALTRPEGLTPLGDDDASRLPHAIGDLDGDGRSEVVVASKTGTVRALDASGQVVWST